MGNLYFTDDTNGLVRRIAVDGTITTVVGAPGSTATVTEILPASVFMPIEVAIDSTDNLNITVPNAVLTLEP